MQPRVLIGSSIPAGLDHIQAHKTLKQGDIVLTLIPPEKEEALAVARYCKDNKIHLCFGEFLTRGDTTWRHPFSKSKSKNKYHTLLLEQKSLYTTNKDEFYSKADIDEIIDAAGDYYFSRVTIGEAGGVMYWPKAYTFNRRAKNWVNLPACKTHAQAQKAYVAYCKKWLDHERKLGKGALMDVDSSLVFKHHVMAGVDVLCLEVMPGDPHLMHAAIRGAARTYNKTWGAHIAMQCYGGMCFDEIYQKRWRTSLFFSYIAGAEFIYPESGHYTYSNRAYKQKHDFHSKEMKRIRGDIRDAWQFARIHSRPANGPRAPIGVVYGNLDGAPGLWNRYAWGQYYDEKWLEGPAERSWQFVDNFHRKEDWPKESIVGEQDFSGNPPCGQYDIVPIEASQKILNKYSCLLFLSWNTMTPDIYKKLKQYVKAGGHLVMFLPHLSTRTDRAKPLTLYKQGDFSDLFGAKITGKFPQDMRGIKCMAASSLKSWRFPLWRISTDPRFMGNFTPARAKVTSGKVICGWSDFYVITDEELSAQPLLVENSLGKGKAYLVTAYEYPADEGMKRFTNDLMRTIIQGEQADIRLLSTDRIRYAVYDDTLPKSRKKYSVIYMLNTDPDNNALARIHVRSNATGEFRLPANELRLAYLCGDLVIIPEDKCVDIDSWKVGKTSHNIGLFSARNQKIEIHNLGKQQSNITLNGVRCACKAGASTRMNLKRRIDPARKEFFAKDFLNEPKINVDVTGLPY